MKTRTILPKAEHGERHFTSGAAVRDVVIGMSDGLTVPFALAAGLSGAIASSGIVVTAGLAEVAAGSIAMGLGGYLAARGDAEHYDSELRREYEEIELVPERETQEVLDILVEYGVALEDAARAVEGIKKRPDKWTDFMMRFELGLDKPDPKRAFASAFTIAVAYIVGGMVPLAPYMLISNIRQALAWSCGITLIALAIFGAVKARFSGSSSTKGALQTVVVGGLAAGAAFLLARLFAG